MSVDFGQLAELTEQKPAPPPLVAVQAFANTLDVEEGIDRLESLDAYKRWLRESGLAARNASVSAADLKEAHQVRGTIRALLAANERGDVDRKAAKVLGQIAADHRVALSIGKSGELEPDLSPAVNGHDFVCLLLGIVFHAQVNGTWPRLKLCENDECQWAFYDSSKNRSGSWCQMGVCGNRLKNRAYRQRKKQGS
jgi:predicted RNA-binding Zn ribbon-like protein